MNEVVAVDCATLAARIVQMARAFAIVERVASMPKQGVSSTAGNVAAMGGTDLEAIERRMELEGVPLPPTSSD
jgi:hypothetical protein